MGITNFNKWLSTNYPSVHTTINVKEYDNVYIDINPILHVSINKAKNEKDLIKRIIWLIDEVLKHIVPKKRLIFSTDGIPAFAKMILQRERRIGMVKNLEIKNTHNFINPIILTPGTDFMNNLPKLLEEYFISLKNKYNIHITSLLEIEKGESEFKLFNKMKKNINKNTMESNILVSNDADVIIMALSISSGTNIMIANSGKKYQEISLNKLYKCLDPLSTYSHLDFTLLMLLMGNDYIPKLNYIMIQKVLPIYMKVCIKESLVICGDNYSINNKLLGKIIFRLLGKNKNFKLNSITELNNKKMKNYLEGLVWCLNNYINCTTSNMLYMYNYSKTGINPVELYYYLSLNKNKVKYPIDDTQINLSNMIYPAIVLPYKINFLVKKKYSNYLYNNHRDYYDEELCDVCKDYHIKLSDLNITRRYVEDMDGDTNSINKDIRKYSMELNKHKKINHKRLEYSKYIEIINGLNSI